MNAGLATSLAVDEAEFVQVIRQPETGQNALLALQPFRAGEVLAPFGARTMHATPNYLTVQVGEGRHIELDPAILQYMNHSCEPNCFFDTARMEVVALRDIAAGEELGFFYPSSEWHMAQPFDCLCGATACLRRIAGADSLPPEVLGRYRLTEFIARKLRQHRGNDA